MSSAARRPEVCLLYTSYKDFEGWEATGNHMVDTEMYTASRYNATIGHIRSRDDIDVWYDSPAVHLIQDPVTKIVHGVTVNHEGCLLYTSRCV